MTNSMKTVTMAAVIGLTVAACSSDTTGTSASVSLTSTSAPEVTTTSAPAETTTSSGFDPTTTVPPAATTTVAETTTTTMPAAAFGFFVDGFGIVDFGASPDEVQAALDPLLGPPTIDSGWIDEPLCPGDEFRFLQYGDTLFDFRVLFAVGDPFTDSIAHPGYFFTYAYNGDTSVPVERPALTVGTTIAELEALHPDVSYQPNPFISDQIDFVVDGDTDVEGMIGQVSGTALSDTVEGIQGGIGCGE